MKKQDQLEDFIRNNRTSFDDLRAPDHIWKRIDKQDRPVHAIWKWTAVAASGLLLLAIGYIMGFKTQAQSEIAGWDEYIEAEQYYQGRIDHQMEKIKTLPVHKEVLSDISLLDEVYQELREQLLEDPDANAELLLSAMIKHQQQKLDIMERILNQVDKYQRNENDNREM